MSLYSRNAYFALKEETTENTAVTPDVFIPIMSEDIVTEYGSNPATPLTDNRVLNIRPIQNAIPAPEGTVSLQVEPKTFGNLLKGVYGSVTTGEYMAISSVSSGPFQVGETITGGSSAATATVDAVSQEDDYLLLSSVTGGPFTDSESISGGTSSASATVDAYDSSVSGHEFKAPQSSLPTYTVEIGLENEAYRYTGVRISGIDSVSHSDNIITCDLTLTSRAEYKHGYVTSSVSSGSGSKQIPLDQTTGLASGDSIKIFRPDSGFQQFDSNNTNSIDSVDNENQITVTNLDTALEEGDLIVLAPQTASYTTDKEFAFIGGTTITIDDTISSAVGGTTYSIEEFDFSMANAIEPRHGADGTDLVNRFPAKNILAGLTGEGSATRAYVDMTFLDRLRKSRETAINVKHEGNEISSSGINYTLDWRIPDGVLTSFNPSVSEDDVVVEELGFDIYSGEDEGYFTKALLVNDTSSY